MLLLRMLAVIAIVVCAFALWLSYTYGITIDEWWNNQKAFFFSDKKSDEEIEREMRKKESK